MTEQTRKTHRRNDAGFTLVEVLAVMAIIALLVFVVVANVGPALSRANVQKAQTDIAKLDGAVEHYFLYMKSYPDEAVGLSALRALPAGTPNADQYPKGGFIKKLPDDPWGRPYVYRYPGETGTFDIISYGADGQPGGAELDADISNGDGN